MRFSSPGLYNIVSETVFNFVEYCPAWQISDIQLDFWCLWCQIAKCQTFVASRCFVNPMGSTAGRVIGILGSTCKQVQTMFSWAFVTAKEHSSWKFNKLIINGFLVVVWITYSISFYSTHQNCTVIRIVSLPVSFCNIPEKPCLGPKSD
jgi:hypothetical protein